MRIHDGMKSKTNRDRVNQPTTRRRGDSSESSVGGWLGPVARVSNQRIRAHTNQCIPAEASNESLSPRTPSR